MASSYILDDEDLQKIYTWVDEIPLSRAKKNITRDFSDGVLLAEVVRHYFPKLVEMHNYSAANSVRQKMYNWATLNQKVFRRLQFAVEKEDMEACVNCKPGAVEILLMRLQRHIADIRAGKRVVIAQSPQDAPQNAPSHFGTGSSSNNAIPAQPQFPVHTPANANANVRQLTQSQMPIPQAPVVNTPQLQPQNTYIPQPPTQPPTQQGYPTTAPAPIANTTNTMPADYAATQQLLAEKDGQIGELQETVDILELKVKKLEQLVRLKDSRIQTLTARLSGAGGLALNPAA